MYPIVPLVDIAMKLFTHLSIVSSYLVPPSVSLSLLLQLTQHSVYHVCFVETLDSPSCQSLLSLFGCLRRALSPASFVAENVKSRCYFLFRFGGIQ